METERTLVLVKPDGVARGLVGDVVGRVERKGLRFAALELRTLDRETAERHYAEHREKPFFGPLVDFITSGPLVAAVTLAGAIAAANFTDVALRDPDGVAGRRLVWVVIFVLVLVAIDVFVRAARRARRARPAERARRPVDPDRRRADGVAGRAARLDAHPGICR